MYRGFPTHPESLTNLTNTLLGAPILYQPVMLAQLGPDITGGDLVRRPGRLQIGSAPTP